MKKEFNARRLDVRSFAEEGAELHSDEQLRTMPRLMQETDGRGASQPVHWQAQGELRNPRHVQPDIWIHLKADAKLSLTCQRCLGEVQVPVEIERSFRFVPDESTAAAQDEEAQEDVLALTRSLDLHELVEEELLMALPLAPMHEVCPQPVKMSAQDEDFDEAAPVRENPFALLKGGRKPH